MEINYSIIIFRRQLPQIATNPSSRFEAIYQAFGCVSGPNSAATFSAAYRCACDRLNAEYKPFVAWDVDTIFWMHEDREMSLSDFEQGPVDTLLPKDYLPLFSALQYDTWFVSLNLSHIKVTPELVNELCSVLSTNRTLVEMRMSSVTGRSIQEILTKIQQTLERCHGSSTLSVIDFSNNSFDDKAIASLCTIAGCLASRLSHLSLARCHLTKQHISQLSDAPGLRGAAMAGNLTHLDLSFSSCKSDEISQGLCNLISSATNLKQLNLSSTDINLQHLGNALAVASSGSLLSLDLSQNHGAFRCHSSNCSSNSQLAKFLQTSSSLRRLSLADNRMSSELHRHFLNAFANNSHLTELEVDYSNNDLQKIGAVPIFSEMLPIIQCFSGLNFSENGLDGDFAKLVDASQRCLNLFRLNFSKNSPSTKMRVNVTESLASILQSPDTRIRILDISDNRFRQTTSTICAALTDSRLHEVDISGNQMGDSGAVYLAKALQGNTRLRRLHLDKNQISLIGFQALLAGLSKNFTLTSFPTPFVDVAPLLAQKASSAERCQAIFTKIENLLTRNRDAAALGTGQAIAKQVFRFQTGCGISENLENLWQLYGETEDLFMSIQPPGGLSPSAIEEPVLHEADQTLTVVREILKKLSNMQYPAPNISSSEKFFGESLENITSKSFQPVIDHLLQAAELLSMKERHHLLPISINTVKTILEQTAQSCANDCHRETNRALTTACYMCHYASLFRVLESITVAIRDRLTNCRACLTERAAKGRMKTPIISSLSSPGSSVLNQSSKYGTLNRRQRPVSAMTPDSIGAFDEQSDEVNQIYNSNRTPNNRRPMMTAEMFETPPPPAPFHPPTPILHKQHEHAASPGPLLSNPCKQRPKKPKNQRPSKPVVEQDCEDANNINRAEKDICTGENGSHTNGTHAKNKTPPSHEKNDNEGSPVIYASAVPVNIQSTPKDSPGEDGYGGGLKESSLLNKAPVNKPVVGGVKVGPSINLSDLKLKKIPNSANSTGDNEMSTPTSNNGHNSTPLTEESNGGSSGHSVLRPKVPAKPAKPPKPVVTTPLITALKETGVVNKSNPESIPRPSSPPDDESSESFADRLSRFGVAAKPRRQDIRSMIEPGSGNSTSTS